LFSYTFPLHGQVFHSGPLFSTTFPVRSFKKGFASWLPTTFEGDQGQSFVYLRPCWPLLELTTFVFSNIPGINV
jgi:hypothetical protein